MGTSDYTVLYDFKADGIHVSSRDLILSLSLTKGGDGKLTVNVMKPMEELVTRKVDAAVSDITKRIDGLERKMDKMLMILEAYVVSTTAGAKPRGTPPYPRPRGR